MLYTLTFAQLSNAQTEHLHALATANYLFDSVLPTPPELHEVTAGDSLTLANALLRAVRTRTFYQVVRHKDSVLPWNAVSDTWLEAHKSEDWLTINTLDFSQLTEHEARELYEQNCNTEYTNLFELGLLAERNRELYEFASWNEWRLAHWGCIYDPEDVQITRSRDKLSLSFTASATIHAHVMQAIVDTIGADATLQLPDSKPLKISPK